MTLDHWHVLVTATLLLSGFVSILLAMPKVSKVRRPAYWLAAPLWATMSVLYLWSFFTNDHTAPLTLTGVTVRVIFFGIALEGLMVPYLDLLEADHRRQAVALQVKQSEEFGEN